jgi:hypothetical protein
MFNAIFPFYILPLFTVFGDDMVSTGMRMVMAASRALRVHVKQLENLQVPITTTHWLHK